MNQSKTDDAGESQLEPLVETALLREPEPDFSSDAAPVPSGDTGTAQIPESPSINDEAIEMAFIADEPGIAVGTLPEPESQSETPKLSLRTQMSDWIRTNATFERFRAMLKFTLAVYIALGVGFSPWAFSLLNKAPVLFVLVVVTFHPARTVGAQIQQTIFGIVGSVMGGIFNSTVHATISHINSTYPTEMAISLSDTVIMVLLLVVIYALAWLQYIRFPSFRFMVLMADFVIISNVFIGVKNLVQPDYFGVWLGVATMCLGLGICLAVNVLVFPDTVSARVRGCLHESLNLISHALHVIMSPPSSPDPVAQLRTLSEKLHAKQDQLENLTQLLKYEMTVGKVRPREIIAASTEVAAILAQLGGCTMSAGAYWSSRGAMDSVSDKDREDLERSMRELGAIMGDEISKVAVVCLNPQFYGGGTDEESHGSTIKNARSRFYTIQNRIIVSRSGTGPAMSPMDPKVPDVSREHAAWDFFTPTPSALNSSFFLLTVRKLSRNMDHMIDHLWQTFGHADPPKNWIWKYLLGGRRIWFPEIEVLRELLRDVGDFWADKAGSDGKANDQATHEIVESSVPRAVVIGATGAQDEAKKAESSLPGSPTMSHSPFSSHDGLGLTRRRMTVFVHQHHTLHRRLESVTGGGSVHSPAARIPTNTPLASAIFSDGATVATRSSIALTVQPKPNRFVRMARGVFAGLQSPAAMFALKSALSNAIALIWAFIPFSMGWFEAYNGVWISITVMIVLQPGLGTTTVAGALRIIGTIVGGYWATFSWWLVPAQPAKLLALLLPVELVFAYILLFVPTFSNAGMVALNTWIVIALDGYQFVLENKPQSMNEFALFATIRVINVSLGVVVALFAVWFFLPQLSRIAVRSKLSRHLHSQSRLFNALNELFLSPLVRGGQALVAAGGIDAELVRLKAQCRAQLQDLRAELRNAAGEPDLEVPFSVPCYTEMLRRCQNLLDLMAVMEDLLTSDWSAAEPAALLARRMLPERRRLLASIHAQFGTLAACLMLKEGLPPLSPAFAGYEASAAMTSKGQMEMGRLLSVDGVGRTPRGLGLQDTTSKKLNDATSLLYLFAFGSAIRRTVVELDAIEIQVETLFGRESPLMQRLFD